MNTKWLLGGSAVFLAAGGLAGTFLPQELLTAARIAPTAMAAVLVQLLGALLFAFAMTNWMARGSLMGGIYNRPLAIGNFSHFLIGGLALVKAAMHEPAEPALWPLAFVYVVFAAGFAIVLFRSPAGEHAAQ